MDGTAESDREADGLKLDATTGMGGIGTERYPAGREPEALPLVLVNGTRRDFGENSPDRLEPGIRAGEVLEADLADVLGKRMRVVRRHRRHNGERRHQH